MPHFWTIKIKSRPRRPGRAPGRPSGGKKKARRKWKRRSLGEDNHLSRIWCRGRPPRGSSGSLLPPRLALAAGGRRGGGKGEGKEREKRGSGEIERKERGRGKEREKRGRGKRERKERGRGKESEKRG